MNRPTREEIDRALSQARTSDAGWQGLAYTKLAYYVGKLGVCSLWVNNKFPTQFVIKVGLAKGEFAPGPYTMNTAVHPEISDAFKSMREFPCLGKEHALEIFERTVNFCDEEVAQA